jgi:hypothetical protein
LVSVSSVTVSPSFKCATARNSDEAEVCADPELAARDTEIARVHEGAHDPLYASMASPTVLATGPALAWTHARKRVPHVGLGAICDGLTPTLKAVRTASILPGVK